MSGSSFKAIAFATCLSFAGAAQAATIYKTTLSGLNPPATGSPGTGAATLVIDGNSMEISVDFAGLTAPTTVAHIHCCAAPGFNAGVATPTPTFPGFPAGVTSGVYNQTFDLTLPSSFNPDFITSAGGLANARTLLFTGLDAGEAYLNIHTTAFPGGEIRGHWAVVPEPQTWALMIAGFVVAGAAIRRRRAALAY